MAKDDFFEKLINFCVDCFLESESSLYPFDLESKKQTVKGFDIFSEKLLSKKIQTGEFILEYREALGEIVAAAVVDVKTGRLLFFLYKSGAKKQGKEVLDNLIKRLHNYFLKDEYALSVITFYNGAERLEQLGFYKVKSELKIQGIYFKALKYKQDQDDNQIF